MLAILGFLEKADMDAEAEANKKYSLRCAFC